MRKNVKEQNTNIQNTNMRRLKYILFTLSFASLLASGDSYAEQRWIISNSVDSSNWSDLIKNAGSFNYSGIFNTNPSEGVTVSAAGFTNEESQRLLDQIRNNPPTTVVTATPVGSATTTLTIPASAFTGCANRSDITTKQAFITCVHNLRQEVVRNSSGQATYATQPITINNGAYRNEPATIGMVKF
jgi:hypothetical protein